MRLHKPSEMEAFAHAGMSMADLRSNLREAEKALRRASRAVRAGKLVDGKIPNVHRAGKTYDYWLMAVASRWSKDAKTQTK